uniref:Uncharacterized protein n=1 Tax=Romanomermis culicivorax TaxID=13658 RepID=A0A915HG06_ROMCU
MKILTAVAASSNTPSENYCTLLVHPAIKAEESKNPEYLEKIPEVVNSLKLRKHLKFLSLIEV